MAEIKSPNFDYKGAPVTVSIRNITDTSKAKACDAGTPAVRTLMTYDSVAKLPGIKWEYLFTASGKFATVPKTSTNDDGTLKSNAVISDVAADASNLYVVTAFIKYKNTDVKVPAYRTMNSKTLKVGESMAFKTSNKDEVVFYEKVKDIFAGQLEITFEDSAG